MGANRDKADIYSTESVIFFVVILFLILCLAILKVLRFLIKRRSIPRRRRPIPPELSTILISHIRIPSDREENLENLSESRFPRGEQRSPPPYTVVSNIPPPSYEDAMKQSNPTLTTNELPKY